MNAGKSCQYFDSNPVSYELNFIIQIAARTGDKPNRIYNYNFQMTVRASIFQSAADPGWIVAACENSRYTGADCNISSLPGRLASINRPIHQAAALPLTRQTARINDGEGGSIKGRGGRHLPPRWSSQAQRWSMMEGLGSGARAGQRLFV